MLKTDIHVHCDTLDDLHVKNIVKECEQTDTRACIMSGGTYGDHIPEYPGNDATLKISKEYSDLFIPFAWIDLTKYIEIDTVKRVIDKGFKGLKFITPYYGYDHDSYMPIYEIAQNNNVPVIFHTGLFRSSTKDTINQRPLLDNMNPVRLDRIARSFPDLKIVMAHLGTAIWRRQGAELIKIHPNLYGDLAGCGNFRIKAGFLKEILDGDSISNNEYPRAIDKLILGSDAYFTHPNTLGAAQDGYNDFLRELNVPTDIIKKIMGETASEWF